MNVFFAFFISFYVLDHNYFAFLWYVYVLVPVIDIVLPVDHKNLTNAQVKAFEKDKRFLIPLYTYVVCDYACYFWGIYMFAFAEFYSIFDKILFAFSISHLGAVGMVIGHELLHRHSLIHKVVGTLCYSKSLYSHFFVEHVKGHHKNVSTPLDPASSVKGQNLFQFFPQTFIGSYKSVWNYETQRLARKSKPEGPYSLSNRLITFNICHVAYLLALYFVIGTSAVQYALIYAIVNIFFLETINYIEHYGLMREKDDSGVYEPVNIMHSWNAPQRYTNYILFKLQRHSDHHANAYKPYQILNSFEDSPALPNGYSASLLTAMCPPVWFKAIDPLVDALRHNKKITKEQYQKAQSICNNYIYSVAGVLTFACYLLL